MTVHVHPEKLSYISVPKCGCTSLKSFFFQLVHGVTFAEARAQGHPAAKGKRYIHNVFPCLPIEQSRTHSAADYIKIAVVRDPVSRLVSCYTNKVQKKGVLREPEMEERVAAAGLSPSPSFSTFLNNIDGYRELSPELHHHSHPLSHFLGTDVGFYTRIFPLSALPYLAAFVEGHVGRSVPPLPHFLRSQQSDRPSTIAQEDVSLIERRYAEDIELYGSFFASQSVANSA